MPQSKRIRAALAVALLLVSVYAVVHVCYDAHDIRKQSEIAAISTLKVQYVLQPSDPRWRANRFGDDFDVTSSSTVMVRNGGGVYEVMPPYGEGAFSPIKMNGPLPDSIAVDNDDTPLILSEGYLGTLEASGEIVDAVPLPYEDMRLAHSVLNGVVYLYGGREADYRLYSFSDDGTLRIVAQVEDPIVSVSDSRRSLYFATANSLFRIRDGRLQRLLKVPEGSLGGPIVSVAVSAQDDVVFFSTKARVYALRGAGAVSIVNDSGGGLRLRGDRLYVLDGTRSLLYTLQPATGELFGGE